MEKQSCLFEKKALFSGDSISYGSSDSAGSRSWAYRISRDRGLDFCNVSRSGWSVSTIRTGRMIDQLQHAPKELYDYVILHGGVNDAWGDGTVYAPVGEMTDSFDRKDYDLTTYAGALEELFHYTYTHFPQAKVGYIINFATPLATRIGHVTDMEAYYAEGIKICEKWGVQYLDLYHNEYVNKTLMEVDKQPFCYMADAVHPNAAGYERLSPIIGDWMESLIDNQKPKTLTDTRSFVTVCQCDDLALWQGTDNTQLTACQTPDGVPAVQLYGKSQNENHVRGWEWLGARAECTLTEAVDLSECALLRLRFYISQDFFGQAGQMLVEFMGEEEDSFRMFFGFDGFPKGWHEITYNAKGTRFYRGNPDLSKISRVRITWYNHNNCKEDFILAVADIHGQR